MDYELVNCRPVPKALAAEIRALQADAGSPAMTSCLRTQDAVNWARARGCTLSSQAELYRAYLNGTGNPANPPGYSTHELRSDGVAFPWWMRGALIPYWAVGQDWGTSTSARAICAAAQRRGWTCTVTYPSNPRELHHVNFRKEPKLRVFRPLRRGDKGPRVAKLTQKLQFVHRKGGRDEGTYLEKRRWQFDGEVERAVIDFQRDHHQAVDGIVGIHTLRALAAAVRREKRRRRIWKAEHALAEAEGALERKREERGEVRARLRDALDDWEREPLQKRYRELGQDVNRLVNAVQSIRARLRDLRAR